MSPDPAKFDPREHRMCASRYFEDFAIGETFVLPSRTMTDALPRNFAATARSRIALYDALLSLKTRDEVDAFLADLCTPAELRAVAERWEVARLLDAGGKAYREIAAEAQASPTTVVRVARFLKEMPHQGYRLVLDRLKA